MNLADGQCRGRGCCGSIDSKLIVGGVCIQIGEFHANMLGSVLQFKLPWEVSVPSTCACSRGDCRVCFRKSNVIMKQGGNRFVRSGDNTGIAQ